MDARQGFSLYAEQLQDRIYRYCVRIAGDRWEAEDLKQDVLLKLYRALENDPSREISHAYMYRIALNAWRDKIRKKGSIRHEVFDPAAIDRGEPDLRLETRELLETLADRLSPRALVILLLMDAFGFTAKETGVMIGAAEGAVQVTLGRARGRLKKLAGRLAFDHNGSGPERTRAEQAEYGRLDFEALVEAFRRRDAKAICLSYRGLVQRQAFVSNVQLAGGKMFFYFTDPDGNRFMVTG
ncbi:RNA polymerase sigma factor [Paenibacillus harenae]|uniref:RNA polymerase sigma-70 factor (ECF subfamily) n=1 Tax=Paenibacillus harenae TaxID=306543 RepID=A0ABT9U9K0_PAEHA|nr:RNA polymerase sigma factor [Paenibacillus harenae]MDQ0115109.1 RNA polymerase sigma-70 factor (ECF subfamily) [Paenibacillus harenae]